MAGSGEKTPLLGPPETINTHSSSGIEETVVFQKNMNPQVLEVRNLHYEVDLHPDWRLRIKNRDPFGKQIVTKKILKGVSLVAKPGQVLAILGSSGSGKTSLLDVLACRNAGGRIEGDVLLNSKPTTQQIIKSLGAYVTQEDRFLPNLTVMETLMFVANMKFPSSVSKTKKLARVHTVLSELGLRHIANTIIGGETQKGISGGERRRVSIGCQLLLDPSLLFLDEPTSGLDSFTAEYIMQTLVNLARTGRTVVTTIHSPRTAIFNLFDQVLLLSQGETVYFGAANQMVDYFGKLGFICPKYTNPCDYFMDIATIDFRSEEQTENSMEAVGLLTKKYRELQENNGLYRKPTMPLLMDGDSMEKPLNMFYQFVYLYLRASKNIIKGKKELLQEAIESIGMGLVIGAIYFNIGYTQVSITDRYGLFFIMSSLFPFMVILNVVAKFNKERPPFFNERQDGLYDLLPYFLAKTFSELPFDVIFSLLYSVPSYFMIGLNPNPLNFVTYLYIILLSIYTSRSIALATAAGIVNFHRASFVGNLMYSIFLIPSGFLINLDDMWEGVRWVADISYLKFSFEALATNEFVGLNFTCTETALAFEARDATQEYCIRTGEMALRLFALGDNTTEENVVYLLCVIVVFRLIQYVLLRVVNQRPE